MTFLLGVLVGATLTVIYVLILPDRPVEERQIDTRQSPVCNQIPAKYPKSKHHHTVYFDTPCDPKGMRDGHI